jgi:hypothetical protein
LPSILQLGLNEYADLSPAELKARNGFRPPAPANEQPGGGADVAANGPPGDRRQLTAADVAGAAQEWEKRAPRQVRLGGIDLPM